MLLTLIHLDDPLPPLGYVCRLTAIDVIAFIHDWYSADRIPFSFDVSPMRCASVDGLVVVYLFKKKLFEKSLFHVVSRSFSPFHNDKSLLNLFMNERQSARRERERMERGGGTRCSAPLVCRHIGVSHMRERAQTNHMRWKSTRWQMTNPFGNVHDALHHHPHHRCAWWLKAISRRGCCWQVVEAN